ncbi:MAG: DUF357 domain-containing protein [Methanotrichaceae archaeon]|nr:DUF357 domain-containing protein [Methanotrichaceae archaeon]
MTRTDQLSDNIEENLRNETTKWLERAEQLFCGIAISGVNSGHEHFMRNISAYISDSKYFLKEGDLIRAFESVVWAWAWIEIGLEMGILKEDKSASI